MADVMADRREAPRYPLILAAEVVETATGATLTGRSSEVSRTGCYIDTLNPVPLGSQVCSCGAGMPLSKPRRESHTFARAWAWGSIGVPT
jgi:hypothetical protein